MIDQRGVERDLRAKVLAYSKLAQLSGELTRNVWWCVLPWPILLSLATHCSCAFDVLFASLLTPISSFGILIWFAFVIAR